MIAMCMLCVCGVASAQRGVEYRAAVTINVGDGALAPYYMASNRYGTLTQGKSVLASIGAAMRPDSTSRFSYGFGAEMWGGWTSSAVYDRYEKPQAEWTRNSQHPSRVWLQQLYAELKYRGVYAVIGQKEHRNALTDAALSSGDLVLSGNARPLPGVSVGFVGFQDLPLTHGWVQVNGELGFYRDVQNNWLRNHYNYYTGFYTTDTWFNYKRMYFRTKPSNRVSVTVGMQASCQFGGERLCYHKGDVVDKDREKVTFKTFVHALFPGAGESEGNFGDAQYKEGNHVGSWDLAVRYTIDKHRTVRAYYQSLFEDGSGIGKLNGWDGLYGLEYRNDEPSIVTGAVIEYIDFMNQSGPIHWAPNDFPDSPMRNDATGADNYYNNFFYNGYSELGMSIGSPFVKSTIYNRDGYLQYLDNRIRGVHAAVTGYLSPRLTYRVMASYRKSWGTPFLPRLQKLSGTSVMIEGNYMPVPQVAVKAQLALDRGGLYGNNFGAMLTVAYSGVFGK